MERADAPGGDRRKGARRMRKRGRGPPHHCLDTCCRLLVNRLVLAVFERIGALITRGIGQPGMVYASSASALSSKLRILARRKLTVSRLPPSGLGRRRFRQTGPLVRTVIVTGRRVQCEAQPRAKKRQSYVQHEHRRLLPQASALQRVRQRLRNRRRRPSPPARRLPSQAS